jgi:lysophospholipase L1-like esterase
MRIVVVGDSISEGAYATNAPAGVEVQAALSWPHILAAHLGGPVTISGTSLAHAQTFLTGQNTFTTPADTVLTAAAAFATSTNVRDRFTADALNRAPDLVFIACGVNDIQTGTLGNPYVPDATTKANLAWMASAAKAAGIRVVLCGLAPLADATTHTGYWYEDDDELSPTFGQMLEVVLSGAFAWANPQAVALSAWIRDYAEANGHRYFDWYATLGGPTGGLMIDGLHPGVAGHAALGAQAYAIVSSYPTYYDLATEVLPQPATVGGSAGSPTGAAGSANEVGEATGAAGSQTGSSGAANETAPAEGGAGSGTGTDGAAEAIEPTATLYDLALEVVARTPDGAEVYTLALTGTATIRTLADGSTKATAVLGGSTSASTPEGGTPCSN